MKETIKKYIPSRKDIGRGLVICVLMASLGYIFGYGFGVGASQTYQPVVIKIGD